MVADSTTSTHNENRGQIGRRAAMVAVRRVSVHIKFEETMADAAATVEELVGGYKPGSIKRVKLTNFLTYENVEFCPGPR